MIPVAPFWSRPLKKRLRNPTTDLRFAPHCGSHASPHSIVFALTFTLTLTEHFQHCWRRGQDAHVAIPLGPCSGECEAAGQGNRLRVLTPELLWLSPHGRHLTAIPTPNLAPVGAFRVVGLLPRKSPFAQQHQPRRWMPPLGSTTMEWAFFLPVFSPLPSHTRHLLAALTQLTLKGISGLMA